MTGETDVEATVFVLIDGWPEGEVDERAWVSVADCPDYHDAPAAVEHIYPTDDRFEGERYGCDGERCYLCPEGDHEDTGEGVPWRDCAPEDDGALEFWVVDVLAEG